MAKKASSPFSILVYICLYRVLNWTVTLQKLYNFHCYLLQKAYFFIISTWEDRCRVKNSDVTASNSRPYTVNKVTITNEDLEIVMGKLGIVWEKSEEEINGERLVLGEIPNMFNEIEPSVEEVKEAFDLFDENKDGYIDAKELEKMLCGLGIKETSESECQKMILAFDQNGDRRIDFREFVRIVEDIFC